MTILDAALAQWWGRASAHTTGDVTKATGALVVWWIEPPLSGLSLRPGWAWCGPCCKHISQCSRLLLAVARPFSRGVRRPPCRCACWVSPAMLSFNGCTSAYGLDSNTVRQSCLGLRRGKSHTRIKIQQNGGMREEGEAWALKVLSRTGMSKCLLLHIQLQRCLHETDGEAFPDLPEKASIHKPCLDIGCFELCLS